MKVCPQRGNTMSKGHLFTCDTVTMSYTSSLTSQHVIQTMQFQQSENIMLIV